MITSHVSEIFHIAAIDNSVNIVLQQFIIQIISITVWKESFPMARTLPVRMLAVFLQGAHFHTSRSAERDSVQGDRYIGWEQEGQFIDEWRTPRCRRKSRDRSSVAILSWIWRWSPRWRMGIAEVES